LKWCTLYPQIDNEDELQTHPDYQGLIDNWTRRYGQDLDIGYGNIIFIYGSLPPIYRTQHDSSFHYPIDMGPYHWVIGIVLIIGGLYFVYTATKMIIKDKRKDRSPH
jgi:hypothetical protein